MLVSFLTSCKKDYQFDQETSVGQYATLIEVKEAMMHQLLLIARKSPEFRNSVESESLKQVRGDYNVSLDRLIEIDKHSSIIPLEHKAVLYSLTKQMKQFRNDEMPIIFVPIMENRDPKYKMAIFQNTAEDKYKPADKITIVDQDGDVSPFKKGSQVVNSIKTKSSSEGKEDYLKDV